MARLLTALFALGVLAALPAAEAQAGANDPKITVSVEILRNEPTIPLGGTQTMLVNVKLTTNNVYCNNQGTVTVALSLKDSGLPGVTGSLPTSVDVPVRANVQPPSVTSTSQGNNTAALTVNVATTASPDHAHAFTVTANTPASLPTGCQALSAVPPPAASATADAKLKTGPGTGSPTATTTAGGAATTGGTTSQDAFFLPLPLQVAALLAVGLVGRRL